MSGLTLLYIGIGAAYALGLGWDPIFAAFWWSIAALNELADRTM